MKNKKSKIILLSILIGTSSLAQANTSLDPYGIDIGYHSSYSQAGCSELGWQQTVAAYQSKVNEYNQKTKEMNRKILESSIDPSKFQYADCLGDAKSTFEQLIGNAQDIINNGGSFSLDIGGLASGIFGKIKDRLTEQACSIVKDKVNGALKKSGISDYAGEFNNMSKNPFGYVMNKTTGSDSIEGAVHGAIDKELGGRR